MKKNWSTPKLTVYGSVEKLTQKTIDFFGDAVLFGGDDNSDDNRDSIGSL